MNGLRNTLFLTILISFFLVFSANAFNEKISDITVQAESLRIDEGKKVVTFSGKVNADAGNFIINCEKLRIYYGRLEKGKEKDKKIKIKKIAADGSVRIEKRDGTIATGDRAYYEPAQEMIVIEGYPTLRRGDDRVEGAKIILFIKERRYKVVSDQKVRVKASIILK